jgi:hypothetical protein
MRKQITLRLVEVALDPDRPEAKSSVLVVREENSEFEREDHYHGDEARLLFARVETQLRRVA